MTPSTSTSTTPIRFRVVSIEDGMLLRQLLCKRLHVSPAIAAEIVRAGGVYVGSVRLCVPTVRVSEGERVTVYRTSAEVAPLDPGTLRLLYRDEACVIVDSRACVRYRWDRSLHGRDTRPSRRASFCP